MQSKTLYNLKVIPQSICDKWTKYRDTPYRNILFHMYEHERSLQTGKQLNR